MKETCNKNKQKHPAEHKAVWNSEKIFKALEEWTEDDGAVLAFNINDSGELPVVVDPSTDNVDELELTHWMKLPPELKFTSEFKLACIKSGIE